MSEQREKTRKIGTFLIGTAISIAISIVIALYGPSIIIANMELIPLQSAVISGAFLMFFVIFFTFRVKAPTSLGNQGKGEEDEGAEVSSPPTRPEDFSVEELERINAGEVIEEDSRVEKDSIEPIAPSITDETRTSSVERTRPMTQAEIKSKLAETAPQLAELYDALPTDVQSEILHIYDIASGIIIASGPVKTLQQLDDEQYEMPAIRRAYSHRRGGEEDDVPPPGERVKRRRLRRKKEIVEKKETKKPRKRLKKHRG